MNINPYAWTSSENTGITSYPAQVRVKLRSNCPPLFEKEFKPVIEKNYYTERLFWFELDKEQLTKLIKLFSPPTLPEKPLPGPPNAAIAGNMFHLLSGPEINDDAEDEGFTDVSSQEYSGIHLQEKYDSSSATVVNPERKWSVLFEASSSSNTVKNEEELASHKVCLSSSMEDHTDMELKLTSSFQEISTLPFVETSNGLSKGVLTDVQSSGSDSVIMELMGEIEGLKLSQLYQQLRIDSLELELKKVMEKREENPPEKMTDDEEVVEHVLEQQSFGLFG